MSDASHDCPRSLVSADGLASHWGEADSLDEWGARCGEAVGWSYKWSYTL